MSIGETAYQEKQGRVVQTLQPDSGRALCPGSSGEPGERYLEDSYGQAND